MSATQHEAFWGQLTARGSCGTIDRELARTLGRLGGEEFAILLPDTGATEAMQAAERMRHALAESRLQVRGKELRYSASFGVAAFVESELSLDEFLARADAALYLAKAQGRNRIARG